MKQRRYLRKGKAKNLLLLEQTFVGLLRNQICHQNYFHWWQLHPCLLLRLNRTKLIRNHLCCWSSSSVYHRQSPHVNPMKKLARKKCLIVLFELLTSLSSNQIWVAWYLDIPFGTCFLIRFCSACFLQVLLLFVVLVLDHCSLDHGRITSNEDVFSAIALIITSD